MELKPTITAIFLLFLLVLAVPCFSRGGLDVPIVDSGIYDIDYRGPETHSNLPPPNRFRVKPNIYEENAMEQRRSKGLRAGTAGGSGNKLHG